MVSVKWVTRVVGEVDAIDAVFEPHVNTRVFGELVYSHTVVNNSSGETQTLSFQNKSGVQAFTLSFPDGQHNLFWKTNADGVPLWAFVISNSFVPTTRVDASGNYYVVAGNNAAISIFKTDGTLEQTVALQEELDHQTLIIKFNSSGAFQKVIRFGSDDQVEVPRIQIDGGNLYAIGNYTSNVTVLDSAVTSTSITGGTNTDMFTIAFDSDAEVIWWAKMTGTEQENISVVEVYENTLYVTGVYASDPLVLTPGTGSTKNFVGGVGPGGAVGYGITIALNKTTGAYEWAVVFDAENDLKMITTESHSSGLYIIGTIPGADVEIKNGDNEVLAEIGHDESGSQGVFVTKVSHAGAYIWHARLNSSAEITMTESFFNYHEGSILDSSGNVYVKALYYLEEGTIAPNIYDKDEVLVGSLIDDAELDTGHTVIAKILANGSFGWITRISPVAGSEFVAWEMYVGQDNNLYLTANAFVGNVRFFDEGKTTPTRTITTNSTDFFNPFIFSYSSAGKYRWAVHIQADIGEFGPLSNLITPQSTRMQRMNLLFNIYTSRLALSPNRRVYLNLIGIPGENGIFVQNTKARNLEFEAPLPYLLALDGSTSIVAGGGGLIGFIIVLIIIVLVYSLFAGIGSSSKKSR